MLMQTACTNETAVGCESATSYAYWCQLAGSWWAGPLVDLLPPKALETAFAS
jgi:hypothetical protein